MRKKILLSALIGFIYTIKVSAQIIAGSGAPGLIISNPNVNLSVSVVNQTAVGLFDLNCDSVPDMRVELFKGATVVDGANTAYLYVMNSDFQLCADTANLPIAPAAYYNGGDPLNCTGIHAMANDTIYQLGTFGCMDCTGPYSVSTKYLHYVNTLTSQSGWIELSFNLIDGGSSTTAITLTIPEILSPCTNTACAFPTGGSGTGTCGIFSYNYSILSPYCAGTCTGSISITGLTGGTPAYDYNWSNGASGSSISSACAGSYSVTFSDGAGASCTSFFNVTDPLPVTYSLTTTNVSCNGSCDGSICVTGLTGGTAPYTYMWMPMGITVPCINFGCAGSYTVCVTDANGCMVCLSAMITEPPAITVSGTVSDAACSTCCDGDLQLTIGGGSGSYTTVFSPSSVPAHGSYCPGVYGYCVTDMNGCNACDSMEVPFALGIYNSVSDEVFSVFPNPNKGEFTIRINGSEIYFVELINNIGEKVYAGQISEKNNKVEAELSNGIYILKAINKESGITIYKKVVVSN